MNIVLVHGAWADGSSWRGVIPRLQQAGHNVAAPQFPLNTLADNVARLRQVLVLQDGPTVVAGHSFGGQIMTALGTDAPNVVAPRLRGGVRARRGRVHRRPARPRRADARDRTHQRRRSRLRLVATRRLPGPLRSRCGPDGANIMYAVQQPLTVAAFDDVMGVPTWKNLPSWFAVAQHDEVIPPDAERLFAQRMGATVVELDSSHVAMVSHPEEVTDLIETAIQSLTE